MFFFRTIQLGLQEAGCFPVPVLYYQALIHSCALFPWQALCSNRVGPGPWGGPGLGVELHEGKFPLGEMKDVLSVTGALSTGR